MNRKNGFTLIELLAVIVILAIIALIATPIVLNIIEDSKKSTKLNSANHYVNAVEQAIMKENIGQGNFIPNECEIQSDGNLKCDGKDIRVEVAGDTPILGTIKFEFGKIRDIKLYYSDDKYIVQNPSTGKLMYGSLEVHSNGSVVYYDVKTGKICTNYHEDNSKTGYNGVYEGETSRKTTENQNSCLKFYIFNDDKYSNIINLLLDHNTTALVSWNSSKSNDLGPSTSSTGLLGKLKIDTNEWVGTIEPQNYEYKGKERPYIVNYSGYKARLITAQEIAKLTSNQNWDETISSKGYYFDTLSQTTASSDCIDNDETTVCKYGWLYDRTSTNCTSHGCLNLSDSMTWGYWTASPNSATTNYALYVRFNGGITDYYVPDAVVAGVRPVIQISKFRL